MDTSGHGKSLGVPVVRAPQKVRYAVWGLELVLLALISFQLYGIFADQPDKPAVTAPSPSAVAAKADGPSDFTLLTTFDPFFRAAATPQAQEDVRAPESSLELELFGLRAEGQGAGSAIVKMPNSQQKLVRVGDAISAGVTLVAVYNDRLEIRRAGAREAIYLRPETRRYAAATAVAPTSQKPSAAQARVNTSLIAGLEGLALAPVRRDRRIVGFRLPEDTPLLLTAVGLEAGDILTAANGSPLTSYERIAELGEELAGARSVELTIERRGETRSLKIGL